MACCGHIDQWHQHTTTV